MMRYYLTVLLFFFVSLAHGQEATKLDTTPSVTYYHYYENAQLNITEDNGKPYGFSISKGKGLVFEFFYRAPDYINIADDEYYERIVFEVPKGTKSFSFQDSALAEINTLYRWSCFCPNAGTHTATKGTITGKKLNRKTYQITLDITSDDGGQEGWAHQKKFDKSFICVKMSAEQ